MGVGWFMEDQGQRSIGGQEQQYGEPVTLVRCEVRQRWEPLLGLVHDRGRDIGPSLDRDHGRGSWQTDADRLVRSRQAEASLAG